MSAPAWLKRAVALSLLWSIPAVIQATTLYAAYQMKGDDSMSLWIALAWRIPEWQVWALATPAILWASRRWPVTRAPWLTLECGGENGAVATIEIPFEEHVGDR